MDVILVQGSSQKLQPIAALIPPLHPFSAPTGQVPRRAPIK